MQRYEKNLEAAKGWEDFLNTQEWKRFCTFTTQYELTLPSSRRLAERFYDRISQNVFPGDPNLRFFWCAEKFEAKDGFHIHGLLNYSEPILDDKNNELTLDVLNHSYQIVSGANKNGTKYRVNFSKFDKTKHGSRYCSKYITKKLADFDLLVNC